MAERLRAWASTVRDLPGEVGPVLRFLRGTRGARPAERLGMIARFYRITLEVDSPHKQSEMLEIVEEVLGLDDRKPGCVVEAGCYQGGSATKLSLACAFAGRRLRIYDSFEGLPANDEVMDGAEVLGSRTEGPERFEAGAYRGSRAQLERNLRRLGSRRVCSIHPGRFADTLPALDEDVAIAFVDVDLAASTRTCLRHLWPRLVPGGILFSHDGHLPLVRAVLRDEELFDRLGGAPVRVVGLGERRLVRLEKGPAR